MKDMELSEGSLKVERIIGFSFQTTDFAEEK